jgi:hypothetical protein
MADLLVLAAQRFQRDVLGHQQLEPVEQLAEVEGFFFRPGRLRTS